MPARKRGRTEAELDSDTTILAAEKTTPGNNALLTRLRNMWEFAAFMQYCYIYGTVVKIDENFDMDELELECLRPEPSERLSAIGLSLLKYVSSHRGLTPDIFDEYTRRQYEAKAPHRNPFGEEEEPKKFRDFDVFTKIRVLLQLSTWTLGNAQRMRDAMQEKDETSWRIEELGWDKEGRSYFVLDDDRLYRRTDAPLPAPTPKKPKAKSKSKPKPKAKSRGTRASKRIKLDDAVDEEQGEDETELNAAEGDEEADGQKAEDDTFGGMKWECLAVTIEDYEAFLESIRKSKDADEKELHSRISEDIMPVIQEKAEKQRQKALKRARELENLQKLATAKRSSRLADKKSKEKEREEAEAAEKKRLADLAMAKKEQQKQKQLEAARESRMITREQRLRERETKRIVHEEELRKAEENMKNLENGNDSRISERQLKSEMERRQKELDMLAQEEGEWVFDCAVCGMHGENLDDGTHSIACEKCSIWQHSVCHGIKEEDAERDDFHFVCSDCKRKEEDAKKPKIPPLKLKGRGSSASPQSQRAQLATDTASQANGVHPLHGHQSAYNHAQSPRPGSAHSNIMNGPSLSPSGQSPGPPGHHPLGRPLVGAPQHPWPGQSLPPPPRPASRGYGSSPPQLRHVTGAPGSPPPIQIHQQAHESAVSSSNLHFQPQSFGHANGHSNGNPAPLFQHPPQPHGSPQKQHSRPRTNHDSVSRPSSMHGAGTNGGASTPHQQAIHAAGTPSSHQGGGHANLFNSPGASFPPPSHNQDHQRAAGHSPTKQPSSSPAHHSPSQSFYTPQQQYPQYNSYPRPSSSSFTATPHQSFNASSQGQGLGNMSSPIPPLPENAPLIPQKHDTPRPTSRDSIGDVRVVPPPTNAALSPANHSAALSPNVLLQYGHGRATDAAPASAAGGQSEPQTTGTPNKHAPVFAASSPPAPAPAGVASTHTTLDANAPRPPAHRTSSFASAAGIPTDDGGVRGVMTSFGEGSVPVKKMAPAVVSSPPRPGSAISFAPNQPQSRQQGDIDMKDA